MTSGARQGAPREDEQPFTLIFAPKGCFEFKLEYPQDTGRHLRSTQGSNLGPSCREAVTVQTTVPPCLIAIAPFYCDSHLAYVIDYGWGLGCQVGG